MVAEESLSKRTSIGVLWMTAQKWLTRLGSLATIIILTRVLSPEDFGTAAAASTLLPVIYVVADVGFSTYIVQATDIDQKTLNTAFWFSLLCGTVLALAVVVAAPVLAAVLGVPEVAPLLAVMSGSILIIATASVPIALMRRRMAFRSLAVMEFMAVLIAQAVAIVVALVGGGAWALVLQIMVSQLVTTMWVWFAERWRPGFTFSGAAFRRMGSFGVSVVGSELALAARGWIETAIVVTGLGVREMGYLNIAQRLVLTAQNLTVAALLPVSTVAFSKVRDSVTRLRLAYQKTSSVSYAAATPLMIALATSAPIVVPFLFGTDKTPSAPITPALSIAMLINVGAAVDYGLHLGIGRPARWLIFITASYGAALVALALTVRFGLLTFVTVLAVAAFGEAVGRWFLVAPMIEGRLRDIAPALLGVVAPSVFGMCAGVLVLKAVDGLPPVVAIGVTCFVVVTIYLLALRFMRPSVYSMTLLAFPERLSSKFYWTLGDAYKPKSSSSSSTDD